MSGGGLDRLSNAEWKLKLLVALIAGTAEERTEPFALGPDQLTGLHLILAEIVEEVALARRAYAWPKEPPATLVRHDP